MIKTVYEDDYLLVVDKPSGLLVVPTPKKEKNTLTDILRLYPCHRLDRDTSGLIIYAKSKKIQQLMMLKFRRHQVNKEYIAFVRGRVKKASGRIKSYLKGKPKERPKFSVTDYKVVRYFNGFTEVCVRPITGRTNQIRIHFKQLGHPLLGERRFAFGKDFKIKFKRTALHAGRLYFKHPITNRDLRLYSKIPSDLQGLVKQA